MNNEGWAARIEAETAESYEIVGGRSALGLVLLCDHAANALPAMHGTLGLQPEQMERHIAYDIGAAGVTRHLAHVLGVPAVLTRYSRLLIDPNRGEDDPTLVMRLSDGAIIPGNRRLDDAERERRITLYYRPYHGAIRRVIERCCDAGRPPALISLHSFTEIWNGIPRPWDASVLWEPDPRIAGPLLDALRAEHHLVIGENEPYPGQYEGDTLWQHATVPGLPSAIVEIRQDHIRDTQGQRLWAERLARILAGVLAHPALPPRSALDVNAATTAARDGGHASTHILAGQPSPA